MLRALKFNFVDFFHGNVNMSRFSGKFIKLLLAKSDRKNLL